MSTDNLSLTLLKVYIWDNNVLSNRNTVHMVYGLICRSILNRLFGDYHRSEDHSANLYEINSKVFSSPFAP